MGASLEWRQLWGEFKTMPDEMKAQVALSLDGGEQRGFENWVESRSPKAQVDVLDNAPDDIKEYFYKRNILSPFAVFAMDIKSKTPVKDMRSRRFRQ